MVVPCVWVVELPSLVWRAADEVVGGRNDGPSRLWHEEEKACKGEKREEFTVVLLLIGMGWVGGEGRVIIIHGGAEMVWLRSWWREREWNEREQKREKLGKNASFLPILNPIFFILGPWNPPYL